MSPKSQNTVRISRGGWLRPAVATIVLGLGLQAAPAGAGALEDAMNQARLGGDKTLFAIPARQTVDSFAKTLQDYAATGAAPSEALLDPLGFEMIGFGRLRDQIAVIREKPEVRGGGGVYFFAQPISSGGKLVLCAPHSFFDLRTGLIAMRLFEPASYAGLLVNTVHRYNASTTGVTDGNPADCAHNTLNFFYGATVGLARGRQNLIFVQLHGMDGAGTGFDFILSDGTKTPPADGILSKAGTSFQKEFGTQRVGIYGKNVSTLGGTTNTEGQFLNGLAPGRRFLHVEMASAERSRLATDSVELGKLRRALETATK